MNRAFNAAMFAVFALKSAMWAAFAGVTAYETVWPLMFVSIFLFWANAWVAKHFADALRTQE